LYGSLREYVLVSSVRHAAVFTLFGRAEEPYNGLAARGKEQRLTSQERCSGGDLHASSNYWDIKGSAF
jgi:hypothetical protein